MKRFIITAVLGMFLGVPSYGQDYIIPGFEVEKSGKGVNIAGFSNSYTELLKKQLESMEEIRNSITGARTINKVPQKNDGSLYFSNPQSIYNNEEQTELAAKVPQLFREIIKNENYLRDSSIDDAREAIDTRRQYAAIIDKAVTLQIFQEIENRFQQITDMLVTLDKINDLKGIIEMKTRMEGMLLMIQNEAAKLKMVAHSRDIEQTLIDRLKRKRNVQILGSLNRKMPNIR
ncbi:type IV secretion system protein [Bartonella phoceensis]|uniref:type IV secretion system protein n=1 Tax=Bartonella phoceensis TaxID=270249 RepID=UPI001ABA7F5B|nr:type IV secretion system protein [Bartonella phoceensis]